MKVSCFFFWNVKELANQKIVEMLFNFFKLHTLIFVFIVEPMMSYTDALDVLFKYVNQHLVATSPIVSKAAKLCCLSVPNLVQYFLVNGHFISINCFFHDKCFSFAGVYDTNTYLVRRLLWKDLSFFTRPWCILGDFNVVLSANNCKGGLLLITCNEFLDWINNNDLTSMPFSERKGLQRIDRKLDRALCNEECLD